MSKSTGGNPKGVKENTSGSKGGSANATRPQTQRQKELVAGAYGQHAAKGPFHPRVVNKPINPGNAGAYGRLGSKK